MINLSSKNNFIVDNIDTKQLEKIYLAVQPPSMTRDEPVTIDEALEAK